MLHFAPAGDPIPNFFRLKTVRGLRYNDVHAKIILLCSDIAYVISPHDGSHSVLQELPTEMSFINISCIDPQSGDVVVEMLDSIDFVPSRIKRISVTTTEMTTIELEHLGWDHWSMHPCRMIFLNHGERIVLGG